MSENLRIAMIAPPWYPVPPRGYGGIELVVHLLHQELKALGHELLVFGAEGSGPDVIPLAPAKWAEDLTSTDRHVRWDRHFTYCWQVMQQLKGMEIDLIHDHTRPPGMFFFAEAGITPNLFATIHEPVPEPRLTTLQQLKDRVHYIGISHAHAATYKGLPVAGVVHNAVDLSSLTFRAQHDGYLLQLARINPNKGQHLAIQVANALGKKLVLAGKVDPTPESQAYFDEWIRPVIGSQVEYLENVSGVEKAELIARAEAGVFPLQWEEPFGLAMLECMVSGTPVLALSRGAAPELIEHGVSGFLAHSLEELIACGERLQQIDRTACAQSARDRFSPLRMAQEYVKIYRSKLV